MNIQFFFYFNSGKVSCDISKYEIQNKKWYSIFLNSGKVSCDISKYAFESWTISCIWYSNTSKRIFAKFLICFKNYVEYAFDYDVCQLKLMNNQLNLVWKI